MPETKNGRKTSRDRLARISHHFLSEIEAPTQDFDSIEILPVIFIQPNIDDQLIMQRLTLVLHQLGNRFVTIREKEAQHEVRFYCSTPSSNLSSKSISNEQSIQVEYQEIINRAKNLGRPEFILLPDFSIKTSEVNSCRMVLIFVNAELNSLMQAYLEIKHLVIISKNLTFAITICNTDSFDHAYRCFSKLSSACQQFLSTTVSCPGYLPCYKSNQTFLNDSKNLFSKNIIEIANYITLQLKSSKGSN